MERGPHGFEIGGRPGGLSTLLVGSVGGSLDPAGPPVTTQKRASRRPGAARAVGYAVAPARLDDRRNWRKPVPCPVDLGDKALGSHVGLSERGPLMPLDGVGEGVRDLGWRGRRGRQGGHLGRARADAIAGGVSREFAAAGANHPRLAGRGSLEPRSRPGTCTCPETSVAWHRPPCRPSRRERR
jgi:hypothetical protein